MEQIDFDFDGQLLTSKVYSGTLNETISYSYNNDFDLSGFSYAGDIESYAYDNDGLLTTAGSITIARNAGNGLPEALTDGDYNLSRTFNGYGEVDGESTTYGAQSIYSFNIIERDQTGRITDKTETVSGTSTNFEYTYDSVGRLLTAANNSILVEEYGYDGRRRRNYIMNSLRGIPGTSLYYDDEDHLLSMGNIICCLF